MNVFTLNRGDALRLATMEHIASKDGARPTIQHVQLAFDKNALVAAATDSYRLAIMSIDNTNAMHSSYPVVTVTVPAKEFAGAIKTMTKLDKTADIVLVPSDEHGLQVTVTGDFDEAPNLVVKDTTGVSEWINWDTLFNGQDSDGRVRYGKDEYMVTPDAMTLPAFQPKFLADWYKLMGPTQAARNDMLPTQMTHLLGSSDHESRGAWRPWAFVTATKTRTMGISMLLMPINLGRREDVTP